MQRKATLDGREIVFMVALAIFLSIISAWTLPIAILLLLAIIHQLIMRAIFFGPSTRVDLFEDENWEHIQVMDGGVEIHGHLHLQDGVAPLVVFVHGWQSSSERFIERMNIFRSAGCHTLAHDLRGHCHAPDTPEWTAGKIIADLKVVLDSLDKDRISAVHLYGHSIGGFVCIGMSHSRYDGWWKEKLGTIILESPMTVYSPIMNELTSSVPFLRPLIEKMAIKGFNLIHPDAGGLKWKDVDVPHWGMPQVPTLILQAANDKRLGLVHYDALLSNWIEKVELETHLIQSLSHSNNRINEERDRLLMKWIEKRII